jgi:hypothetical protein
MRTISFLFSVAAIFSTSALASADPMQALQRKPPNANSYQVLKRAFDTSKDPLKLQDIDQNTLTCIESANAESPLPQVILELIVLSKVIVPGTPSIPAEGPLLPAKPGVPDRTIKKNAVFINVLNDGVYLDSDFDTIKTKISPTEIRTDVQHMLYNSIPHTITVRKNGNLLTFNEVFNDPDSDFPNDPDFYGYCWK